MYEVRVGGHLAAKITARFGSQRSTGGQPSEWDFWSGPLAAAVIVFRDAEALLFDQAPEVRTYAYVDPVFGPVLFVGVIVKRRCCRAR